MEDYLRRVRSTLGAGGSSTSIHAVLGGPETDVDSVASTLCLALHLSQKEPSSGMCVPVLCVHRRDAVLPEDTVRYLQRVRVHESSLLWQSDVDLVKLHHTGKLSLTLLRDDVLDSSEYRTLATSVLRVVCRHGQRDAREEEEWGASSTAAVAKEILQEAAEHIGPALGETLGEALRLQSESLWIKHGRRSAPLEELMCSLEERCHVTVGQRQDSTQRPGIDMEQLLTKDLKEFSDGEITIAFATVTVDLEDWNGHASKLKVFCHRHSYESLVVVYAVHGAVHLSCQQVAVYADNTDILNQICCELEESSRWFLSGGLQAAECFQGCLQVYQIPTNTSSSSGTPHLLEEEIRDFLKELVDRRSAALACHPIRRTSSTEGVAGSVEFSQGSSGINDMYGSDTERPEGGAIGAVAIARVTADGEEDSGGVVGGAGGELVSPDSGMVMRSSRSSKESSVFLSDDSPIGEILAGGGAAAGAVGLFLRNPSPLGFSSLSPPERRTRRSSRNKSDNVDLFSFDPFHNISHPLPIGGASAQAGGRGVGGGRGAQGSSSLSEYEELSLVDNSIPDSLVGVEGRPPSDRHPPHSDNIRANAAIDIVVPPTPVNSLVGSCPPNSSDAMFFPEDVAERIQRLQHKESVSSSLSEAWDEFGQDLRGDSTSDETETGGSESLGSDVEAVKRREVKEGEKMVGMIKLKADHQRDVSLKPQLSLITEHIESYDTWNPDSGFTETWNPATMDDLQLTPPEMETDWKCRPCVLGTSEKNSLVRDRELLGTLTPETSKEDEDGMQGRKGDRQTELLDFWTYYAQKGFIKSDSGTTTSYPESLDMWNMTIRDDSLSPVTTPETDNLSEHSDSLCGRTSRFGGGASLESPLESVNGGMQMWNTTIQEDSASTLTSPEGAEMGKAQGRMGSWDASTEALEPHASEQAEKEKKVQEANKSLGWKGEEGKESVKIIIQGEEVIWTEEPQQSIQHVTLENQHDQPSSQHNLDTLAMPIPNMVTSTSEYDNVGAGAWSLPSSPDTHASPVGDTIQIEEQSSPFIAVVKPVETERGSDQYQKADRCSDYRAIIADNEEKDRQVFLFEGTGRLRHVTSEGRSIHDNKEGQEIVEHDSAPDWGDQPGSHSPFILVHGQHTSASHHLSPREASVSQTVPESLHLVNWDGLPDDGKKYDGSLDWTGKMTCPEDGPPTESNEDPHTEASGNVEAAIADAMSLSSSSGGDRDGLKPSPDSLLPGSRDDLRSNSDGDSSSGLEMEYIIVSGTVKESERERKSVCRPHDGDSGRREGGKGRSMETFSMLSCAATLLQMQALHRQCQESKELNGHKQRITDPLSSAARENQLSSYSTALQSSSQSNIDMRHSNESTYDKYTTNQTYLGKATSSVPSPDHLTTALSCSSQPITARNHGQTSADNTSQDHTVTEIVNPTQSKCNVAGFHQSDTRSTGHSQGQEGNHDDQSNVVFRSVSSSLRYPSDNFLKAREEVYVHSQISMEDSDEDGHSPSTPPPRPPSLGGLQGWDGQLRGHGIPQISSELQSPVLTNSSFSYNTSLTGTPLSESAITTERDIGLPFAGDLMEEQQQDEEDEQEEAGLGASSHTGATGMLPHSELTGVCSSEFEGQTFEPKREKLHQNTTEYSTEQPMAALDSDEWSAEQQMRGNVSQEAACYGWSPTTANGDSSLSSLTRLQEVTSTKSSTDGQTPYGYNYHYPDQRTETQSDRPVYFETKGDSQQDNTDVYAEFGTEPAAARYGEYYETGVNAIDEYNSRDPGQHDADVPFDREDQDETRHTHHQYDGESLYQPDLHRENEDHAQYVPDGYAHFHSRSFQQGDGAAGMVTKTASNDEDEMDNRADPPSTLDLSGGSNQRKKLSAPPMNVSLDRSEGSVLSDDALDTGDEALDTGDDLDLNIDDLDTPDEAESLDFNGQGELEPCAGATGRSDAVLEYDASEERSDSRLWRSIVIGEQEHRIDMKCIEPYQRVISHGGYYDDKNAIIVFAACFLPDSDCDNYHYVMENLFLYVISTLELMVAEDYMVVYLNGATPRRRMPGFGWMKKCYQMIDRRLKKNLKSFIIVHPSWFIRTVLGITRPFISSKFSSKIKYVNSLAELQGMIPMEYIHIPPSIVKYDEERGIHKFACMRLDEEIMETAAKADKRGSSAV